MLDLAYFGGHRRYFLPPLSPSQPVIADVSIVCWGTFPNLFAVFAPQAHHSIAQHSAVNLHKQRSQYVPITTSATTPASTQSWLEPACRRGSSRCVINTNERRNPNLLGPQKYRYNHSQRSLAEVVLFYTALSPRPFYFVHACGVRVVSVEHGALGICKSSVCTQTPPLCPLHSFAFCSILPSERAERSALYGSTTYTSTNV